MNLRQFDLNLLLVFDMVYSTRSNTKAAEKLGVTQSAVSNALKRLREHLGDPLFERRGHEFVPTAAADRLAPAISHALRSMQEALGAEHEFDPGSSDRVFNLILPDSVELRLMPALINMIRENGYHIGFRTRPLFGMEFHEALLNRRADLIFAQNPVHGEQIQSTFLFEEDIAMVCRKDHPEFADAERFTIADMERIQLVTLDETLRAETHAEREMREKQVKRNIACTVGRLWSLPHLVATTDSFAPMPRKMAEILADRFDLKLFDLPLDRPKHQWHMAWHVDAERDPAHHWLLATIKQVFETA